MREGETMKDNDSESRQTDSSSSPNSGQREAFEKAGKEGPSSLPAEFWGFLMHNKKFWLLPIVLFLLLMGVLLVLGGTAIGPFIYPLF
jgi:hypothetical protein